MTQQRRRFSRDFKLRLLTALHSGQSVAQAAREHDIAPSQIYQWRALFRQYGDRAFQGNGKTYTEEAQTAELERKIGQLTLETDFLKRANQYLQSHVSDQKKVR